jgi:hypothetical protein
LTPAKVANFGPDNPLRSNSSTSSNCRGKGTNTRPPTSRFNTITPLLIETWLLSPFPLCRAPLHTGLDMTLTMGVLSDLEDRTASRKEIVADTFGG